MTATAYHRNTPPAVIAILERNRMAARPGRLEITTKHGDVLTGRISRSTGLVKVPLIVHNARSFGGPQLDTESIVKIRTSRGKQLLWELPVAKQWQVSIVGPSAEQSWHGTVEAPSALSAEDIAVRKAQEEGVPFERRRTEVYVTFLPEGRKVCPACNGQHDRPGRFCVPCINDGDAEAFEDHPRP